MVGMYLKSKLEQNNIEFEEGKNSFVIDCGGNDRFISVMDFINRHLESWTYNFEFCLNIKIDTAYEKIIIEYGEQ